MNKSLLLLLHLTIVFEAFSQTAVFEKGPDITGNIDFIRPVYADSNRVFCFVKAKNGEAFLQKYLTKDFSYLEEIHLPLRFRIVNENNKNVQIYLGKEHGLERTLGETKYLFPGYFLQQITETNGKNTDQLFYIVSTVHGADTVNTVFFKNKDEMMSCVDGKREKFILFSFTTQKIKRKNWLILEGSHYDKHMNEEIHFRDSITYPENQRNYFRNAFCDSKGDFWFLNSVNLGKPGYIQVIFHLSLKDKKLTHHIAKINEDFSNAILFENEKSQICFTGTKTILVKFAVLKYKRISDYETLTFNPDFSISEKKSYDISEIIKKLYPGQTENRFTSTLPADFRFHSYYRFTDSTQTIVFETSGSSHENLEGTYIYTRYMGSIWIVTLDNNGQLIRMSVAPKLQKNTITTTTEDHNLRLFGLNFSWTSQHSYGNKMIENYFSHQIIQTSGQDYLFFNDYRDNKYFDPYSAEKSNLFYPFTNFENAFLHVWETNNRFKHYALMDSENSSLMYTESTLTTGRMVIGIFDDGKSLHWGKIYLKK